MNWNLILMVMICMAVAAMANAVMDKLTFHYGKSIFPQGEEKLIGMGKDWWHPNSGSWKNKYAMDESGDLIPNNHSPWYYFGLVTPAYKEAFPLSSTVLVFVTDAWHLFQAIMLTSFQLAIALPLVSALGLRWWWVLIALLPLKFIWGITFTLFFHRLLKKAPPTMRPPG